MQLADVRSKVDASLAAAAPWLADMARDMAGHTFHHHFALLHGLCDVLVAMGFPELTYAEIGTFCGGSLCFALQHAAVAEAHAIDPLTARADAAACVAANLARWNTRGVPVHVTRALSTDSAVRDAWRRNGTRVHVLFIDGDHSHGAVIRDFELFREFVHPGGFVVFDDYFDAEHSPQVRGAVDAIVRTHLNTDFLVIGTFPNTAKVPPASMPQLNEFVLQRVLPQVY
jgi:predicted O-methyltransferase YrrM